MDFSPGTTGLLLSLFVCLSHVCSYLLILISARLKSARWSTGYCASYAPLCSAANIYESSSFGILKFLPVEYFESDVVPFLETAVLPLL